MNDGATNIFDHIPEGIKDAEVFEELLKHGNVRFERICGAGQTSPEDFWYDQDDNEWVILLQGNAVIEFPGGNTTDLSEGDYIFLPAHKKHRVKFTSHEPVCIWLAVFWK